MPMPKSLSPRASPSCSRTRSRATRAAYGLDFFETIFEVLDLDELNVVAAYGGFPTRYPHWRFGMEYEQLSKGYEYGLSKIYELVINNDPCYAYLLRGQRARRPEAGDGARLRPRRLLQEQLLLRAHQPRDDGRDGEPRHARAPVDRQMGVDDVENFIDACLSLENLIDHYAPRHRAATPTAEVPAEEQATTAPRASAWTRSTCGRTSTRPSSWPRSRRSSTPSSAQAKKFPERPERDVLAFLLEHAPLERLGARHPGHRARRGLLLRAAGARPRS